MIKGKLPVKQAEPQQAPDLLDYSVNNFIFKKKKSFSLLRDSLPFDFQFYENGLQMDHPRLVNDDFNLFEEENHNF